MDLVKNKLIEEYWIEKLSGIDCVFSGKTSSNEVVVKVLSNDAIEKLWTFSRKDELSLYSLILAAYSVLIKIYFPYKNWVIASPPLKDKQPGSGLQFFKVSVNPQETLKEVLLGTVAELQDVFRYGTPDYAQLSELYRGENINGSALLQFGLEYSRLHQEGNKPDSTNGIWITFNGGTSEAPFTSVKFESAIDKRLLEQLAEHYLRLLCEFKAYSSLSFKDLQILSQEEVDSLIRLQENNFREYPSDRTIQEIFEQVVSDHPERIALSMQDEVLTYTELNERANTFAHYLRSVVKDKPDCKIVIAADRSVNWIVSMLGILKAGAAYVPLDPKDPAKRKTKILEDVDPCMVLTDSAFVFDFGFYSGELFVMDIQMPTLIKTSNNPALKCDARSLAYVMYTSGSTGNPKGVLIEHRSVVRLVCKTNYINIRHTDKLLQAGSLSFDASTFEIWAMLLNGGELRLASEEDVYNVHKLKSTLSLNNITICWFTASWFNYLVDTDFTIFEPLNYLLIGGDRLSPSHVEKVRTAFPELKIINGYGPTENTTFSSCHFISDEYSQVPIGTPVLNSTVYILDEFLKPAPRGVEGKIYVGGHGLARGYLNLEQLTKEKFIQHPFIENERLYDTGDIGKLGMDDILEYVGRYDQEVKIRGYRINFSEIEEACMAQGQIEKVVVRCIQENELDKSLIVYFTSTSKIENDHLIDHLKGILPSYMVPLKCVRVEEIPLTRNGKVDFKSLPVFTDTKGTGPQTEMEKKICPVWEDVLQRQVMREDNFFLIGGHSLKATQLIYRLEEALKIHIELRHIFENPVFKDFCALINETGSDKKINIPKVFPAQNYKLSYSQRRIWIVNQYKNAGRVYNVPFAWKIEGDLKKECLEKTFDYLIERHEILRTKFILNGEEPVQKIETPSDTAFRIEYTDMRGKDWEAVTTEKDAEVNKEFNLEHLPLLRAKLIQTGEQEYLFLLTMHHIICDAWSYEILIKEVIHLYNSFYNERLPSLDPLTIQYKDFAEWQSGRIEGAYGTIHKNYWIDQFKDKIAPLSFNGQMKRPAFLKYVPKTVSFILHAEQASDFHQLTSETESTAFIVLIGLLKVVLYHHSGNDTIVVGFPIAGRQYAELENQLGLYINMLPLKSTIKRQETLSQFIKNVKNTTLEAYEHQEYPFDKIVEDLGITTESSRTPLFDVGLNFNNTNIVKPTEIEGLDGLKIQRAFTGFSTVKSDMWLNVSERNSGISVSIDFNEALFSAPFSARFSLSFKHLLLNAYKFKNMSIEEISHELNHVIHQNAVDKQNITRSKNIALLKKINDGN